MRTRNTGFGHGVEQALVGMGTTAAMTAALAWVGLFAHRDAWAALVPALLFGGATIRQAAWLAQGYRRDAIVYWSRSWAFLVGWIPALVIAFALCFARFDHHLASDRVLGCALMSVMALLFVHPFAVIVDGKGQYVRESWLLGSKKHPLDA